MAARRKFNVEFTGIVPAYLDAMAALGLWGETPRDVAENIVRAEIRRVIREDALDVPEPRRSKTDGR